MCRDYLTHLRGHTDFCQADVVAQGNCATSCCTMRGRASNGNMSTGHNLTDDLTAVRSMRHANLRMIAIWTKANLVTPAPAGATADNTR